MKNLDLNKVDWLALSDDDMDEMEFMIEDQIARQETSAKAERSNHLEM